MRPDQKILQNLNIQQLESGQTTAWKAGFPNLLPGDLLVEKKIDRRWRVGNPVHNFAKGEDGYIYRQELVLEEIGRDDVEFEIDMPSA